MFFNKNSENKQQYYDWLKQKEMEPIMMTFIDRDILFDDDNSRVKTLSSLYALYANQENGEEKYQKARELYNQFIDYLRETVPMLVVKREDLGTESKEEGDVDDEVSDSESSEVGED